MHSARDAAFSNWSLSNSDGFERVNVQAKLMRLEAHA